jgi:hypothetical protein
VGQLASRNETLSDNTLSTSQFGALVDLVASRTITGPPFFFGCLSLLITKILYRDVREILTPPYARQPIGAPDEGDR